MATSATGTGFLTQTAYFTEELAASFGFVILAMTCMGIATLIQEIRFFTR